MDDFSVAPPSVNGLWSLRCSCNIRLGRALRCVNDPNGLAGSIEELRKITTGEQAKVSSEIVKHKPNAQAM
ncbi:hypothetical protein Mapa_016265 [Marchantia paleacea]|nr:hypothetical protein Mapa_016265 [Marchantia paleacea]